MTREVFISRYSPNRTHPDDLEAITVQREELLSSAVESIRTSALTDSKHHLLLVGPRGAGKTHSITLIHHRIRKMDDLKPNLRIAWLNEDETSDTLLSLLLRIHRTLSSEYAEEFPPESLETILDLTDRDTATDAASDLLLRQLGDHTLFIMLENLDALFRDMPEIEQKRWRALIQNHPQFCTLATAQRLFNGVSSQEEPFFGFFQITHLHPFKVEDATDLLIKLARLKDDPDLADFIGSPRGCARIRALHHLTGGNQRLFIILSDFINRESLDSLVGPFEELVDEQLTPYYQERLRWLPTLQRKIVEFLCAAPRPVPVKEIARQLFTTHPSIAGQLRDLRKMGYVTSNQRGRESLYELSEPLMRLSYQVKDAKGSTPLRLLVDFLRVWYDHDDLTQRIKTIDPSSTITCNYLNAAISFNDTEGNLRHQYLREDAEGLDPRTCDEEGLEKLRVLAEETQAPDDYQSLGVALNALGYGEKAVEVFDAVVKSEFSTSTDRAQALLNRGVIFGKLGKKEDQIADYNTVIEMHETPTDGLSIAYYNRGLSHFQDGLVADGIADFKAALKIDGADKEVANLISYFFGKDEILANNWPMAFEHLRRIRISESDKLRDWIGSEGFGFIHAIFLSGQNAEAWRPKLDQLLEIYANNEVLVELSTGLANSIPELADCPISPEGLAVWCGLWEEYAKTYPELELGARLLKTGVAYLTSGKNTAALLELPEEERRILEQVLGLEK